MFDTRQWRIPRRTQLINQGLGIRVVVHADGEVHVPREAHLGAHRDGEPPYQSEAPVRAFQLGADGR